MMRLPVLEEVFRPRRCANTYGELEPMGVAQLLQEAGVGHGHRFVDVGSGLGKLVVVAASLRPGLDCYGLEISPYRHGRALEGLERLVHSRGLSEEAAQRVHLLLGDCGEVPKAVVEATHLILTMRRRGGKGSRATTQEHASGEPALQGAGCLWPIAQRSKPQ